MVWLCEAGCVGAVGVSWGGGQRDDVISGGSDAEFGEEGLPRSYMCRGTIVVFVEVFLLDLLEFCLHNPPPDGCSFGACGAGEDYC